MAYVDFDFFKDIYKDVPEENFKNLEWEARRIIDACTTGIDNVKKLAVAYPIDLDDAETVKRCMCKLIKLIYDINTAEASRGAVQREDGTVVSGVVSSVSSGSESISYATSGGTAIDAAVGDIAARRSLMLHTVKEYLTGVTDANGVNLLYMGVYPYVL